LQKPIANSTIPVYDGKVGDVMMDMRELENVVLSIDVPEHGLRAGDVGIVITPPITEQQANDAWYEVEFSSLSGEVIAIINLHRGEIRPAFGGEVAHARPRRNWGYQRSTLGE